MSDVAKVTMVAAWHKLKVTAFHVAIMS